MARSSVRLLLHGLDIKYGLSAAPAPAIETNPVILRNAGTEAIHAFTTRCVLSPRDGTSPSVYQRTHSINATEHILPPHTSHVMAPLLPADTPLHAVEITISIDSVLFGDNTIDGPDVAGMVQRTTIQRNSKIAFLQELTTKLQTLANNSTAVTSWLEAEQRARIYEDRITHQLDWALATRKSLAASAMHLISTSGWEYAAGHLEQQLRDAQASAPPARRH